MSRGLSILVVAALFFSGVAIGALAMHLYYWQRLGHLHEPELPASALLSGWLQRELDLSSEQQAEIERILRQSRSRGGEMRRELKPKVEALIVETNERIQKVLTEKQRQRFETLRRRQRERFERGFLGPPPGPHGHRPHPPPPEEDL